MKFPRLRELRKEYGYSQTTVAKAVSISQRHYSNIENGNRNLSAELLLKLAIFYNVSLDYIVGKSDER